ncbi:hypothetical protein FMM55_00605 [Campylobacter sp. LR196d]|uniref:hypothetical protein n=1 Tax=Campylobacter sp. LR196d TaxID=2593543 RepID=UPI00123C4817|nr:hypothetical protein [Campylobacter sp. LR196d]KAA6228821.1 hypothetical protein FMM55_00605 [Campylobacter sp. LR196d]
MTKIEFNNLKTLVNSQERIRESNFKAFAKDFLEMVLYFVKAEDKHQKITILSDLFLLLFLETNEVIDVSKVNQQINTNEKDLFLHALACLIQIIDEKKIKLSCFSLCSEIILYIYQNGFNPYLCIKSKLEKNIINFETCKRLEVLF